MIGIDVHTSVYDKRDDFGYLIVNLYRLNASDDVMFLDSHHTVFEFRSWLDSLGIVLAFWISILKIFKSLQNYWHMVTDITSFEKHLESSSGLSLSFCQNLVKYCLKNMFPKESLTRSSTAIPPKAFNSD